MFWASSYNLFVTWAGNGQHPWDNLPAAHQPSATLEIGSLRGHSNKVIAAAFLRHCAYSMTILSFRGGAPISGRCFHNCAVNAIQVIPLNVPSWLQAI